MFPEAWGTRLAISRRFNTASKEIITLGTVKSHAGTTKFDPVKTLQMEEIHPSFPLLVGGILSRGVLRKPFAVGITIFLTSKLRSLVA